MSASPIVAPPASRVTQTRAEDVVHQAHAVVRRAGGPKAGARAAGRAAAGLGNPANNSSAPSDQEKRESRRSARYEARQRLWSVTKLDRLVHCGNHAISSDGSVMLRLTTSSSGNVAGFAGLQTCGSVWSCPVCSAKIASRRAEELAAIIDAALLRGYTIALLTMTVRHHKGHSLRQTWDALTKSWGAATSGRGYLRDKQDFGLVGFARIWEATHGGEHGWHPHVHAMMVFDGPLSPEMISMFGERMHDRFRRSLQRQGFDSLRLWDEEEEQYKGGMNMTVGSGRVAVKLADYFNKGTYAEGMAAEATMGQFKRGRRGGRTPFEILADGAETGLADDIELWWEWERTSKGRKQMHITKPLRELAQVDELTDEEIAEEDLGGEDLLAIDGHSWKSVVRWLGADLLTATEHHGLAGARDWLDRHECTYRLLKTVSPQDK